MCKCLQYFLESCYWHLIEKRFCYDESIALYEEPEKEEKNNNFFDNMAFYDCVSVIAGRSIVTIEPLPDKPIVQQPKRILRWEEEQQMKRELSTSKSVPIIHEAVEEEEIQIIEDISKSEETISTLKESSSEEAVKEKPPEDKSILQTLKVEIPDVEIRRKSLRERRLSKSLYLKIDQPKEIPLIRQQSMPKFYLDTPDESQTNNYTSMFRSPSTALTSPVPSKSSGFVYDLHSIVQMERQRVQNLNQSPVERELKASSRLMQIKEKIKLRRVKSSLGPITNLPHSHHHI